ncbi:MAG TPA: DUF2378 family protein [Myxococcales bacterium]|jgi:uncharacterized protein (TIGR02265 family)|nr:DUF2378 family protein [Myxococcales bacterium]
MSEPAIDAALFEGMFVRALRPDDALRAQLKEIGFDLDRMQPRYPVSVWRGALDAARRRLFADRAEERGFRALGNLFIDGYFETIIGKVLAIPLKLMSIDRVIQNIPKSWKAARPDLHVDPPQREGPQRWRVHFVDAYPLPGFLAGVVEGASRRTSLRSELHVDIERLDERGFDLVIRW